CKKARPHRLLLHNYYKTSCSPRFYLPWPVLLSLYKHFVLQTLTKSKFSQALPLYLIKWLAKNNNALNQLNLQHKNSPLLVLKALYYGVFTLNENTAWQPLTTHLPTWRSLYPPYGCWAKLALENPR